MRRNFIDFYKEYAEDQFNDYGEAFINWTKFSGYIPPKFSNHLYSFSNDELRVTNTVFYDNEDISIKTKKILHEINIAGYRSDIYLDNKHLFKNKEDEFIDSFSCNFLNILLPKANFNPDLKKTNPEDISLKFKKILEGNMMRDRLHLLDNFIEDFNLFLNNIPVKNNNEKFEFYELQNINHYFSDIGVLISSKTNLSENILFYQIGDNN